jgi:hypothetical protein
MLPSDCESFVCNRMKINFPEKLLQLWGLEIAKVHELPLVVQNRTASGHERHARVLQLLAWAYRGTSLIRNSPSLGPYSRAMPRV